MSLYLCFVVCILSKELHLVFYLFTENLLMNENEKRLFVVACSIVKIHISDKTLRIAAKYMKCPFISEQFTICKASVTFVFQLMLGIYLLMHRH
jgi:hypothetical protein